MVLPEILTRATFRLSLPSPFQVIYNSPLCAQSPGACGLVSGEVYLWPNVTPLSAEYSTFKLSFPSPFHARYRFPFSDAIDGLSGLVPGRVTLPLNTETVELL